MVFHPAPPQPASNARIICSPQLVGGALASQNGFKHLIPANVVSSVGMFTLKPNRNPNPRALSIRNRVHHLASSVGAIASRKKLWVRRLARLAIDHNSSTLQPHLTRI